VTSLASKRVLATGGAGFLGRHVADLLSAAGAEVFVPRSRDYDLRKEGDVLRLYRDARPDIVVHMAVNGGGIGYNRAHPASILRDNVLMNTHVTHHAAQEHVEKLVAIGTVCSYPKHTPAPFREEALWDGYPEETNAPYGLSKKLQLVQGQACRDEYGLCAIHLLMVNMYGPHDNFDPASSHVIPALMRRYAEAASSGAPSVTLWGTGAASREFLYVKDAARAVLLATEQYDGAEPVNVGSGCEISIRELADMVRRIVGYDGETAWDSSMPDGQPRRCLDVSRARRLFGFFASTPLERGLEETWNWYCGGSCR
jgi:GDP-L-fucose synthase